MYEYTRIIEELPARHNLSFRKDRKGQFKLNTNGQLQL